MKAITTKYFGPSNVKGSRIIAREPDGKSLTIGYPHELDSMYAHRKAAEMLRDKLGWLGKLEGGWIGGNAWAWVFKSE